LKICYICGNEGFKDVGQGQYLCYRDKCVHRHEATLIGAAHKRMCFICGREGEGYKAIGQGMYKCSGERCKTFMWVYHNMTQAQKDDFKQNGVWVAGKPAPTKPVDLKKIINPYPDVLKPNKTEVLIKLLKRGAYSINQLVTETDLTPDSVKGMLGPIWGTGLIKLGYKIEKVVEEGIEKYKIGE